MADTPGTTLDLCGLRRIAEAATPGPWVVAAENHEDVRIETAAPMPKAEHAYGDQTVIGSSEWTHCTDEDAAFIAAFNPATVLALLDIIEGKANAR